MTRENPSLGNFCVICQQAISPANAMARGCDGQFIPACRKCWDRISPERRFELATQYHFTAFDEFNEDVEDDDDPYGLFRDPERN